MLGARRLSADVLLVPRRAESSEVLGDGMVEIGPDDPEYNVWEAYLERRA